MAEVGERTTFGDFVASIDHEETWLIPGFLADGGLNILSGLQKRAFKTYLAIKAGLCVRYGRPFLGSVPTRTGPVLILEEEGTAPDMRDRFWAIGAGLGISRKQMLEDPDLLFSFQTLLRLDKAEHAKRLVKLCRETQPALVIIDSLSSTFRGDENNVQDVNEAIETLTKIRKTGAAILLLVHLSKSIATDKKRDIDDQVRGSSHITASYDSHLAVRNYDKDDLRALSLFVRSRSAGDALLEYAVQFHLDATDNETVERWTALVSGAPNIVQDTPEIELAFTEQQTAISKRVVL